MKKIIVLTMIIILVGLDITICRIEFDSFTFNNLLTNVILLFVAVKIDTEKHKKDIWKAITVYTISALYLTTYNFICLFIDTPELLDAIITITAMIGVVYAALLSIKFMVRKFRGK